MKKTKIICTIGPACTDEQILTDMALAGMDVARLNFSHGTFEEHKIKIDLIKKVRDKMNIPLPIMLDTKGPEYRIKTFKNGFVTLIEGQEFAFTSDEIEGDEHRVSLSYKNTVAELKIGDNILLNSGNIILEVIRLTDTDAITKVIAGGEVGSRKSMSFPGKVLKQVYLSEQDKQDILFGIQNEVDFIACSFVSSEQDLFDVREFLKKNGGASIDLIAKIENRSGVTNIEQIINASDGIMIGRGDMGVEIPFEELPTIQKYLIKTCRMLGKRVITATEMLESMIYNPRPTRAEISDVANAVYDGTSAIMLSGESAVGKYPVLTVQTMSKIALETEKNIDYHAMFKSTEFKIKNTMDALSHSTCGVAIDIKAKLIVACTRTGSTARMVSRFRSPTNILGMTTDVDVWRKLALSWGVTPVFSEEFNSIDVLFYHAIEAAKSSKLVKKGDSIVITGGSPNGQAGNTNLIKIEYIR